MGITWICSKCKKYQGDGPFYMTSGLVCDDCKKENLKWVKPWTVFMVIVSAVIIRVVVVTAISFRMKNYLSLLSGNTKDC